MGLRDYYSSFSSDLGGQYVTNIQKVPSPSFYTRIAHTRYTVDKNQNFTYYSFTRERLLFWILLLAKGIVGSYTRIFSRTNEMLISFVDCVTTI